MEEVSNNEFDDNNGDDIFIDPSFRKRIALEFLIGDFIEMKKVLFKHGLTPQEFIGYVFRVGVKQDTRVMSLVKEAGENNSSFVEDGKKSRIMTANDLFGIIEKKRKVKNEKLNSSLKRVNEEDEFGGCDND